jgi:3'(2'), 5'-bisphosphate nucleotidase
VYAPTTDTLWCGARGFGAFRKEADGSEHPLQIGSVIEPTAARITVTRSRHSDRLKRALSRIAPARVVPMGSAGLKGALVAEGNVDAYVAVGVSGKLWDACAMDALVSAAGGVVTDLRGAPLDYRSGELELSHGLLVANPALHAALLQRLQSA